MKDFTAIIEESYTSSIDHPAYIAWQTLSSEIAANLKHGAVRISRANTLEYTTIQEEGHPPSNETIPLLHAEKERSLSAGTVNSLAIQRESNWTTAAFLLVNTALGAGLLNYPSAYDKAGGVWWATGLQIFMALFLSSTMLVLAHCADINNDQTYHDVLLSVVGRRAQQCSAVSILMTCFGVCVTFLIIIGDQYDRFFLSLVGDNFESFWYLDRRFTISATAIVLILPMCYFKRLDFLRYASTLGIFAMIYPVFLTIYQYYTLDIQPGEIKTSPSSIINMLTVIPVICFAYQTHEIVVPVYACMKNRNLRDFYKVVFLTMGILMVTYFLAGTYGYLTFGSLVSPDIMQQYDAKDPLVLIGIVALVIKMITTYPPLVLCGRGAIEGLYAELTGLSTEEFILNERTRRGYITTVWFFLTLLLAIFTPNISVVIEILGCVAAINIFVFPGMCLLYLLRRKSPAFKTILDKLLLCLSIFMMVFGVFIFVVVFLEVVFSMIASEPFTNSTLPHVNFANKTLLSLKWTP